jgi:hypothetical protein
MQSVHPYPAQSQILSAAKFCFNGLSLAAFTLAVFSISANETSAQDAPDAQTLQLNEMAAVGSIDLADALASFTRVKRWADADRWIKQGLGPIKDEAQLAALADRIGADNLVKLSVNDEVSDEAKVILARVGTAARNFAESKPRLAAAIKDLDSSSVDKQLQSARVLFSGGKASVAALVEAAISEKPAAPRENILRAMLKIGGNGTQALQQFAIYGKGQKRLHAIESLTRIDRERALPDLLTALYAQDASESEKEFAAVNLPPITQSIPTIDEAKTYLLEQLKRARRRCRESENDLAMTTLWSLDSERTSVDHRRVREIVLTYRTAVDAASRLRRIGNVSPSVADEILAADIGYRVLIDADWGTDDQIKSVSDTFGDLVDSRGLSHAIGLAIEQDDALATVGLLRMVGRATNSSDSRTLLVSGDSNRQPLVEATLSGLPRVRYEAAAAIIRLAPPESFPGSSFFSRCVAEMSRLDQLPSAIVIETRSEVAMQQEIILAKMGYQTEVIGSVLDLERCIAKGGDLRLILSKTQLWDISPVEMIDRVRRTPYGQNVPIVFYGDAAVGINSSRWNAISRLIDMPGTPAAYTDLFLDLELVNRLPALTGIDRQAFRRQASDFLEARDR